MASVTPDDLVAAREGDVLELTRGQETELPQALKWQVARADEDYDAALVEARRITVDTTRIASESFPMAVPPEEAERRCRRALMEAWTGRESAAFRLPPSRLALDPADVVTLAHDGRSIPLRLISIADADARGIEAVRQDREAYDLPPGAPRPSALSQAVVFGAPEAVLLDLPQLTDDQAAHRPFAAAHAVPWPGEIAVYRSPSTDGFDLLATFGTRARIGTLVSDFYAGPTSRFDLGNALVVDLQTGTLESVTDLTLFGGANALALESAPGVWEIVQAGAAELIAPGRYRLTRLLRGQRGTEGAMGNPAPASARVVVLDTALASLPIAEADLGVPWNWRIGPASRPVSDETYVAQAFTPEGVGLRPFSVAHVEQPWRRPRTAGDLTIRWTRRSRALAADSWGGLEVPLAEEVEAYEIEILDGATAKRVLSTATTNVVYTAAAQAADWGVRRFDVEYLRPVPLQEDPMLVRQIDWLIKIKSGTRLLAEVLRKDRNAVIAEGNQAAIEYGIPKSRQKQAVMDIQTLCVVFTVAPWLDVRGTEKWLVDNPGHPTPAEASSGTHGPVP